MAEPPFGNKHPHDEVHAQTKPDELPPIIGDAGVEAGTMVSRWRWWMHLLVLASFPLLAGALSVSRADQKTAMLPASVAGLLKISVFEWVFFGLIFAIAWVASRANATQLSLKWRGGGKPVLWGFIYSILLRVLIAVIILTGVVVWLVVKRVCFGQTNSVGELEKIRPQPEHLINIEALTGDPVYFVLTLTLISFVVAGLREELWRSAMLAGFKALFPRSAGKIWKQMPAVLVVAVIFGLGHVSQGWTGVVATGFLGAGLGAIMVWHRSIWEAVIAHGFFDAGTFALLYLLAKSHYYIH